jgi:effector-binding domain-containing protein
VASPAVQLLHLESLPVAVVRRQARQADLSRLVPECCGLVWNELRAQGVKGGRNIAIYWDSAIRLEAGVETAASFVERGDVMRSATPAGSVASIAHFGPYGGLGLAHDAIRDWCREHRQRLAGPSWEIYGHWQDEWNADPSRIRTDVCYLVAPA